MAITKVRLHDTGWMGRQVEITHDSATKRVDVKIMGPTGAVHGTSTVPDHEAARAFRAILEKIEEA